MHSFVLKKLAAVLAYPSVISIFFIICGLSLALAPVAASAQTSDSQTSGSIDQYLEENGYGTPTPPAGFSETPITVQMTPQTPGPQQSVTIDISSYSTDLNRADISWYVNGSLVEQGMGKTELTTTTGKLGTETSVAIVADTVEGDTAQQNITIIPASLDLIWQADSYTPPFYEGKALYPNQGTITIEALPTFITTGGVQIDPKDLVYTWEENGTVLQSDSGYNKQSIQIQEPIPEGPTTIEADVSSVDSTMSATQQITINSVEPQVELYDNDPLLGIMYNQSLGSNLNFTGTQMTITAVPYFFSTTDPNQNLSWNWLLNNSTVTGQTGDSITLRNQNNQAGQATLEATVNHSQYQFQTANTTLSIGFGAATNNAPVSF